MRRWFWLALGWALVVVGLGVIPTPIPFGMLMTAVGAYILAWRSRWARDRIRRIRRRFPQTSAVLTRNAKKLPRAMHSLLRRTDPHRVAEAVKRAGIKSGIKPQRDRAGSSDGGNSPTDHAVPARSPARPRRRI
ncbi:MAG: PGPGW domain-containing protein [Rhodospirillales bacterium]